MSPERPCFFHRNPGSLRLGTGIGYCDVDNAWVICDGDHRFCENPETLTRYRSVIGGSNPLDHGHSQSSTI